MVSHGVAADNVLGSRMKACSDRCVGAIPLFEAGSECFLGQSGCDNIESTLGQGWQCGFESAVPSAQLFGHAQPIWQSGCNCGLTTRESSGKEP